VEDLQQDQRVQDMGQREDQMKVEHRQERCLLLGQPPPGGLALAEGTMPVATGVRREVRLVIGVMSGVTQLAPAWFSSIRRASFTC
jgi:hypothetical protein